MEIINMTGFDAYIADESGEFNIYPVKGNLQHILDFPKAEMNFSFPTNDMIVYVYDTLKDMPEKEGIEYLVPEEYKPVFFDRADIIYPAGFIKMRGLSKYYSGVTRYVARPLYEGEDDCETI